MQETYAISRTSYPARKRLSHINIKVTELEARSATHLRSGVLGPKVWAKKFASRQDWYLTALKSAVHG
jgi:hypothetical protein